MKRHYVNLGTAKTATTWLFYTLMHSNEIDYAGDKEPDITMLTSFEKYNEYYKNYNIGLNFNPNCWMLDSNQLSYINSVATHQSIIFRNPYDFANSLYNFWNSQSLDSDIFLSSFAYYFDYAKILNRLNDNIMILYYDDIVNDPQGVVNQITNYIEIAPVTATPTKINITTYTKYLSFSDKNVKLFNNYIDQFQDCVQKDLLHWKMNV
jgi:hypothetical protein